MRTRTLVAAAAIAAVTAVPFAAESPIDPEINDKIRKEEAANSQVMKTPPHLTAALYQLAMRPEPLPRFAKDKMPPPPQRRGGN